MRNALLRGEALTTLVAGVVLALAPSLDSGVAAQRVAFYAMATGLAAIALGIVAIDAMLRSRPAFSKSTLNDLANPWQLPNDVERASMTRDRVSASHRAAERSGAIRRRRRAESDRPSRHYRGRCPRRRASIRRPEEDSEHFRREAGGPTAIRGLARTSEHLAVREAAHRDLIGKAATPFSKGEEQGVPEAPCVQEVVAGGRRA